MEANFLLNRHLSDNQIAHISSFGSEDAPIIFSLISDIDADGKYCETVIGFTSRELLVFPLEGETEIYRIAYENIETIYAKRMYGNAFIRVKEKGQEKTLNIFRYTFGIAALCDSAVMFVNGLIEGQTVESQIEMITTAFEKQLSVCPRCGRTLSSPGVKCINCESKGRIVKKLITYLKPVIWGLIFSVILSIGTTILRLVPPYLTASLVDSVLPERDWNQLVTVGIWLVVLSTVRYTLGIIRAYILRKNRDRVVCLMRDDVYSHAQHLPMRFYDRTSTGSVITRISGDTSTLESFMMRITDEAIVEFLRMVGIIIIMIAMNWKLALFSLAPVPLVAVGSRIFSKKIAPFYRRIWRKHTSLSNVLTDTIPGIRVIKSFTNEEKATELFHEKNEEWYTTEMQAGKILSVYPNVVAWLIGLGSVVIWILGGQMVIGEAVTTGVLVSFISYANMFYEPVNFFASLKDSYENALSSAERIFDILDAEPEADFGKDVIPEGNLKGKIQFKHVSFSFDRTKKVLDNINLTIEPGDIVGIVGTTGSGKSTLVNLFLRYYDSYQGKILVDGMDIRHIDMEYYRSQIGFVQQEPMMFHDTIFNNIAFGNGPYTVEEVIRAADIANAHEFIIRQPDGYDSVLGERGVGLSGGERQRVSIARAILKNPSILVFDEATASVDSETEHQIQESIEKLICGRTTIMIAHRLSTLSKANKIVVVDDGHIIECGTPSELLDKKGKYWKLVQIQSMADLVSKQKQEENFE